LVEEGTHEELMRVAGGYARLFRMQLSSYSKNNGTEVLT
jgi:ABC-type multidrug transport system fused ATPase/permease subunit